MSQKMMKAMVLNGIFDMSKNPDPLELLDVPIPIPGDHEILIRVHACGVCHTELDEIEGRTPPPHFPVIPGHQVVGVIVERGRHADRFVVGDRVGIGWIYSACGACEFCLSDRENLCPDFMATGRDVNGGYAEMMVVPEKFTSPVSECFSDVEAAPLLCAGAIGYRSLRLADIKNKKVLGLTGFGASGHLVLKMVRYLHPDAEIFVFARNPHERDFALELGAAWAGDTMASSPETCDAIIDTTPVWKPVVEGLKNLSPGGRLVINAIRKEDVDKDELLKLDYPQHIWMEKEIKSVANITSKDIEDFLKLAGEIPVKPEVQTYSLAEANRALYELKSRKIRGAKVLKISKGE
jgi:propanol-preferring alcohol dehydrogenase